eukprot:945830-Alexandrium_andersonii.AAC.1
MRSSAAPPQPSGPAATATSFNISSTSAVMQPSPPSSLPLGPARRPISDCTGAEVAHPWLARVQTNSPLV